MRVIIANLIIILAVILLGLAYRLKHRPVTIKRLPRRRPAPGRWAVIAAGLEIVFCSARFGLIGV